MVGPLPIPVLPTTTTPLLVQTQVSETPFSEITRTNVETGQKPVMLLLLQILQAIQTMNDTFGTKMNEIHNQRADDQNQFLQYLQLGDELANLIYSLKGDGFEGLAKWKNSEKLHSHIHDEKLSEKRDTTKTLDNVSGTCLDQDVLLNLEQTIITYNIKLESKMEHMMMENLRVINILERERHVYKDAFQSEINKRDIISQRDEEILELKEEIRLLHMNDSKISDETLQKMKLEEDKGIETISEKLEKMDYNLEDIHLKFFTCLPYLIKLAKNHKQLLNVYDTESLQRTETLLKSNDGNKDKALLKACETADLNVIRIFLEAGANISARSEYMPLHHAAYNGYLELARLLLDHGANIEGRAETWNTTPLHVAAFWGQPAVLKLLLVRKANVNALNKVDNTPLHDAAGQGYLKEVKLLIEYNANRSIRNNEGYTPEEWAYIWGKSSTGDWLQD